MSSAAASKVPKVVSDPRFRAGRRLLTDAKQGEAAVEVFGSLLQEARSTYGPESVETAPAYYEYGNALFRLYESSRVVDEENDKEDKQDEDDTTPPNKVKVASTQSISSNDEGRMDSALKKRREAAAAAAEKRFQKPHYSTNHDDDVDDEDKKPAAVPSQEAVSKDGGKEDESDAVPSNNSNNKDNNKSSSKEKEGIVGDSEHDQGEHNEEAEAEDAEVDDDDDIHLSLEMMETAFSILDQYLQDNTTANKYHDWAEEQISRVLTGIGDVLSAMERHADAADAYARALQHRQDRLEQVFGQNEDKKRTVDYLHARRLIVESNVLIAQEFLACPEDEDVVTTESPTVLCRAAERVECARGYYEKTREELQETIFLMGQLTAAKAGAGGDNNALDKNDLAKEKEDICFVSTMVMAVGIQLAKIDEEEQQQKAATASLSQQPVKKKAKR